MCLQVEDEWTPMPADIRAAAAALPFRHLKQLLVRVNFHAGGTVGCTENALETVAAVLRSQDAAYRETVLLAGGLVSRSREQLS